MRGGDEVRYVVVRSKRTDDATVRLQSEPILHGLRAAGLDARLHVPQAGEGLVIDRRTCVVFHYNDDAAIDVVAHLPTGAHEVTRVCVGSDIYSYRMYLRIHHIVDLYLMPTDLHRGILAGQVYRSVQTLPEAIDPIAAPVSGLLDAATSFPGKTGRSLVWFGYAESFHKGMTALMPVIAGGVADGSITRFAAIVDEERFRNVAVDGWAIPTIPYANDSFARHAAAFDYAVLSHFPLDLLVNSYIKSPNKAVTALFAGLIPLASDTPAYRRLLSRFGLDSLLFASPAELAAKLRGLDPVRDGELIRASGILEALREENSDASVAAAFLDAVASHRSGGGYRLDREVVVPAAHEAPPVGLREHLTDLLPSAIRSVRRYAAQARTRRDSSTRRS